MLGKLFGRIKEKKLAVWFDSEIMSAKFQPENINNWSDLEELDIGANLLTELPDCFSVLSNLRDLSLVNNKFSTIPEIALSLAKLTRLDCAHNQILELPSGIGQLKKLTSLSLYDNKLTCLPAEIGELSSLQYLHLFDNNLTSIPKEIGKLNALRGISLSGNELSDLPDEILNLSNLESIELHNNQFTDDFVREWMDRFSNTKCKVTFGTQKVNITGPIILEEEVKGGYPKNELDAYVNVDEWKVVFDIFDRSFNDDDDEFFRELHASKRWNIIYARDGLTAYDINNKIVPINIKLTSEIPSTDEELYQWVKLFYIRICNDYKLIPNSKLKVISVSTTGGSNYGRLKPLSGIEPKVELNVVEWI